MELRSGIHLHFIHALKCRSVTKVLNVTRGRPTLKFKMVEDIYKTGDTDHEFFPAFRPNFELEDLPIDCDRAKAESSSMLAGESTVKCETETVGSNCNVEGGGQSELDELCTVTLKQIKERYNAKKRKHSSYVGLSKETTETFSCGKQDRSNLQPMEDECDIMEPLSSLKSKIRKKFKTNKKCRTKVVSSSTQNALSVLKSEEIAGNLAAPIDIKVEIAEPIAIKVEFPEPPYFYYQDMTVIDVNSSYDCNEPEPSNRPVSSEETEAAKYFLLEDGMSKISDADPNIYCDESEDSIGWVLRENMVFSSTHMNYEQITGNLAAPIAVEVEVPEPIYSDCQNMALVAVNPSCGCSEPEVSNGLICSVEPETANDCLPDFGMAMICVEEPETKDFLLEATVANVSDADLNIAKDCVLETEMSKVSFEQPSRASEPDFITQVATCLSVEPQHCIVNGEFEKYMEHADPESVLDVRASVGKEMMEDVGEIIGQRFSDLTLSELKNNSAVDPHPNAKLLESVSASKGCSSDTVNNSRSFSYFQEKVWKNSSNCHVQVPDVSIDNGFQCKQPSNGQDSCLSEDDTGDDTPEVTVIGDSVIDCSSIQKYLCRSLDGCSVSISDDLPPVEEKPFLFHTSIDAATSCSTDVQTQMHELVTSTEVDSPRSKLQHSPERLLSTRKAISPTSQKRLCKAVESHKLDDEEYYKYARKLCYMKQPENKIGRLEGANQIKRAEFNISPQQINRRPRNNKTSFHHKGILKGPKFSPSTPCISTGCTSVQDSAISFSKKQMTDIESIATKLTKELKSMRDIVEGAFYSNGYPATPLKYNENQVRIAIQNASRVEESAKRFLSIMARDCNRFCKIMKLTEKTSASSANTVHKEKRKIVFADEAGGNLCHVKIFENDRAASMDSANAAAITVD